MPDVFPRFCINRDDALREKLFAGDLRARHFAVADIRARSAENSETGGVVIRNRVPDIAAANLPSVCATPGFRGHLQLFRFEWLRRIARHSPETPNFFSGF